MINLATAQKTLRRLTEKEVKRQISKLETLKEFVSENCKNLGFYIIGIVNEIKKIFTIYIPYLKFEVRGLGEKN